MGRGERCETKPIGEKRKASLKRWSERTRDLENVLSVPINALMPQRLVLGLLVLAAVVCAQRVEPKFTYHRVIPTRW
jgi:hypothetical protein